MIRALAVLLSLSALVPAAELKVNDRDYLEARGLSVLVYQNVFHPVFRDQKLSAIEIILHDNRIATDGDVRLEPTPEQWAPVPHLKGRQHTANGLTAYCEYTDEGLSYRLEVEPEGDNGFRISVDLDHPLPPSLVGKAGFNLDFLPTAYFGKSYLLDDAMGVFPRHPDGPMKRVGDREEPVAFATGHRIVLSPEDPMTRVTISSESGPLMLYDARNQAQNGWFVVRTLIPANRTENAVVWHVHPNVIPNWTRPPVVAYNQVGYTPERSKVAVIELDPNYDAPKSARVLRLSPEGGYQEAFRGEIKPWGKWMRYQYAHFDFSAVREPGIYALEYAGKINPPFRIATGVYSDIWHLTLDTYLAEQMDHVKVREGYRIWHGLSHMDDARQAPVNHVHFDGYRQGATTDTPYQPGEHIPGLNVGGWFDAGDFDLRTQSQVEVITDLALTREFFGADWDDLSVDEGARYVEIRKADGAPDILEQIKHGVLALLAQYKAAGHALNGIIEPTLEEYTHLGDAASQTDGRIYSAKLGPLETQGDYSGAPDDRWAFTTRSTALEYDVVSGLAAASRVLRGYDDRLAEECLTTATRVWKEEDAPFKSNFETALRAGKARMDEVLNQNPYGVPIARGGWGGSGAATGFAAHMYFLHQAFPDIIGTEYTLRGLDYVLGTHPVSNVSFVSAVGADSKLVAYGNNRADYTFIPGGIIPGVLIVEPDFPELKNGWPFLWFENEYVIGTASSYILAANAANAVAK